MSTENRIMTYTGVVSDPISQIAKNGTPMARFNLEYVDISYNELEEKLFQNIQIIIECYDEIAEAVMMFVISGQQITVEGRFKSSRWGSDSQVVFVPDRILYAD